jgi:hypothetical protein
MPLTLTQRGTAVAAGFRENYFNQQGDVMATFWTVEFNANGDPQEIQSDLETLTEQIEDPDVAVYVYIGKKTDTGWKIARTACGLFVETNPWLVSDVEALRTWVPLGKPKGVVFGFDGEPDSLLTDAETVLLNVVRKAIVHAL